MTNQSTSSSKSFVQPEQSRQRVCKACDKCRLKKVKCDGADPCGRCIGDNAICAFGQRTKFRNGVYPNGFVEMLLQEQEWLNAGLHELYRRTQNCQVALSPSLKVAGQKKLSTHRILQQLGVLNQGTDGADAKLTEDSMLTQNGQTIGVEMFHGLGTPDCTPEHELYGYFDEPQWKTSCPSQIPTSPQYPPKGPEDDPHPQVYRDSATVDTTFRITPVQPDTNPILPGPRIWSHSGSGSVEHIEMDIKSNFDLYTICDFSPTQFDRYCQPVSSCTGDDSSVSFDFVVQ